MRKLIVNADDFGLSPGVNAGIARAHEQGIVTSASLMVRPPAAADAAAYARSHPELSVGLHVDLCEWIYRDGEWTAIYEVVPANNADAVRGEVTRQLEAFERLVGRPPTHLDSHQHVHREEPARSIMMAEARRLHVPLRLFTPHVQYVGAFYGQSDKGESYPDGISVATLIKLLASLPGAVTELGCHPGLYDDAPSVYRTERSVECASLCDPRVRAALAANNIALISFAGINAG